MSESLVVGADGKRKIQYTNNEGNVRYIDWDRTNDLSYDGEYHRVWTDEDGEQRKFAYNKEDVRVIEKVSQHVVKVVKDEDVRRLEERIEELEGGDTLQNGHTEYDEGRGGGGVLKLGQPDMRGGKSVYEDVTDALDDLHEREAKGDAKAKQQLDGLFEILGKKIMKMVGKSVVIMGCPRCGFGINTLETTVCPKCSLDLEEKGWTRFGEIHGRKRR